MTWICSHCGSLSFRHVTDDVYRCNGCQARVEPRDVERPKNEHDQLALTGLHRREEEVA